MRSQIGFPEQLRVYAESIVEEALETSEIEGESLKPPCDLPSQDALDYPMPVSRLKTRAHNRTLAYMAAVISRLLHQATKFWNTYHHIAFSERQRLVLNRFLHQFEGKLTAKKWAAITKTSIDTAQRDIADLLGKGVLLKNDGGGKNTSYDIL